MEKGAISRVYAERNFRLFTVGSVVSWLAFFVQMLAVSWLTWELTHSSAWLGIIAFLDTAPFFLFGPIGSVLADRMDRYKLLLAAESCALVQALALALASASGLLDIHLIAALTFIHGMIHAFGVPAQFGLLPRAVSKANLTPAIAINSAYRTLAMFAGPALAGIVLAWFPVYTAFLINAFGYVVYLAVLMMMRLPPVARAEPSGKGYYGDYVDGLRYTIAHPAIALLFLLTFFNDGLRGITGRLLPAFADKVFGLGSTGLAILAGATGIGAAIASIWLAQRQRPQRTSLIALWSFGGAIATTLLFVAADNIWIAVFARIMFGITAEAAGTCTVILLQVNVDDRYRSRVMGSAFLVSQIASVSLFVLGPLVDRSGLAPPLYVFSAVAFAVFAYLWFRSQQMTFPQAETGP